jgi:4-alpha-glucanotransferase
MADTAAKGSMEAELQELARLHGVEVAYEDAFGERQEASADSLLQVLQILGAPVQQISDVPEALRHQRQTQWSRGLEPVAIAWDGQLKELLLRLSRQHTAPLQCRLQLEGGEERRWDVDARRLPEVKSVQLDGLDHVARRLALPDSLPLGYHQLEVETGEQMFRTLLLSAPRRAYPPNAEAGPRTWGVFLPLYALHSAHSWGGGDFADLGRLLAWTHAQGGGVVATLPLLAAFLDEPFECSPYSPVSRLFWNEFYLDVATIPELARCPTANALIASKEFIQEVEALRKLPQVDYRRQMALKKQVLVELARTFFAEPDARRAAFEHFLAERPEAEDYARFRAVGERLRKPWPEWPASLRDGALRPGEFDEEARRYHLYVQFVATEQLQVLAEAARRAGPGLYLDLPLGVHAHGYDVWREREAFAVEASGGAPPDTVYRSGQDWGFPPLHPGRIREQSYRYVRSYLRHQLRYAGVLRIDHMPVFHRLYWIPQGMEAKEGVYVRYPAEELYALFSLESHRHRAMLVGEDLGTVPPEVPASMAEHHVHRMYVIEYALTADHEEPLPAVPSDSVASVNTHDMAPFAAFWEALDIRQREELGLLGDLDPEKEVERRRAMLDALVAFLQREGLLGESRDNLAVLRACLAFLASRKPRVTLVNLEDLWQETQAQNIPSTKDECANWRNKAAHSLEQFQDLPEVVETLREVNRLVR